jgi:hypothetical protein
MTKPTTVAEDVEALRAATREAHEAIKDLRSVLRDAEQTRTQLLATAEEVFTARIEAQVAAGLTEYRDTITAAIESATAAVYRRFDRVADLLLGESREAQRRGEPTLTDYAKAAVARKDQRP